MVKFRQQIESMVDSMSTAGASPPEFRKLASGRWKFDSEEFTPARFGNALSGLRAMLAGIGRDALTRLLKEHDMASPSIEIDGRRARFRESSEREWLTAFGKDTIWDTAAAHPELLDAVWILDFYMPPKTR